MITFQDFDFFLLPKWIPSPLREIIHTLSTLTAQKRRMHLISLHPQPSDTQK
ncbi:hypothetical protein GYMLUDRAFT_50282 [Collybiopsis luxurians FD-317 M1]|uniref:Uncharacterized protein n=1 Tax=Collybiopsis luxurians FD-317 M1 TaxID=944289 RepID=A0A0D0C247_9AGAR|nr:hypothetical protein GYMLUDRAFT_50282 [Collybiopsis luxurians FD-317 M1]